VAGLNSKSLHHSFPAALCCRVYWLFISQSPCNHTRVVIGAGLHYLQSLELMLGIGIVSDLSSSRSLFAAHRFRWRPFCKLLGTETMHYIARRSMDPSHSSRRPRSNSFETANRWIGERPPMKRSGFDSILAMSEF